MVAHAEAAVREADRSAQRPINVGAPLVGDDGAAAVGAGAGSDRSFGLVTELVALANPYTDALPDGLPVQLLYNAAPRADAQIEIFEKNAQGNIEVTTTRTNEAGIAMIEVRPGHIYMLDAVVLRQPSAELAEKHGAVWESLWANLTFAVPAGE